MSEFKRETRYAVFKLKNLTEDQKRRLYDLQMELGPWNDVKECVIVESDWANYADTWAAIQEVSGGRYVTRDALAAKLKHQTERAGIAEFFIEQLACELGAGATRAEVVDRVAQWLVEDHGARLAEVRADAIKQAAQKALDAAQVPPASPIRADYFKAGVRCCAASLVEYAEKVRGGEK